MKVFRIFTLCAFAALLSATAVGEEDWQAFLKVTPRGSETTTNKRGGGLIRPSSNSSRSSSRTLKQNMKWLAEVRYRGKNLPEKSELRVYYIGYRDASMKPVILKTEKHALKLSETGTCTQDLVSPTTRITKSRSRSSGGSRGFTKSTSTTRGERIAGCVVQLLADGKIVRVWTSNSTWAKLAWEDPLTEAAFTRKSKNSLN